MNNLTLTVSTMGLYELLATNGTYNLMRLPDDLPGKNRFAVFLLDGMKVDECDDLEEAREFFHDCLLYQHRESPIYGSDDPIPYEITDAGAMVNCIHSIHQCLTVA